MYASALASDINPDWRRNSNAEDFLGMEKGMSIEVGTLCEEQSQAATMVLHERDIQRNPMRAYGRMCHQGLAGGDAEKAVQIGKRKNDESSYAMQLMYQFLPVLTWVPNLTWSTLRADIIAGLTVGVMVIPQSMSYGSIAGLPYINGMYSACVPTLVYALFGQSRQLAVGPVAMVSLLVEAGLNGALTESECPAWYADGGAASGVPQYEVCPQQYVNLATLTAALVGGMQVVASILRLGFLVSFLGHPVTSGFTSGAAIIIGFSQLKYLVGYDIQKSERIYLTVADTFRNIGETKFMPLILGLATLAFLIGNKKLSQKYKRIGIMGPLGPLICCFLGILVVFGIEVLRTTYYVKYVGEIPTVLAEGWPVGVGGWNMDAIGKVMPTALSACLIGYMESIAIGKNLASKHGYEIEAGQEMFALGISNLVGSLFSCYPVTGSFSRSAVNNSTGALSQFSGVVTALVMLATLLFLTPLFYYLPKFVLAAIVMNSVIPLVAVGEAKKLWRIKREDFLLWLTAFLGTLFLGVLIGIALAVGLSLVVVIYESVRPQITILWRIPGTTIFRNVKQESSGAFVPNVFIARIGSSMYFANASFVKDTLLSYVADLEDVNQTEYIVLEMTPVVSIDSTAVHAIKDLVNDFRNRGIEVAFAMVGNRVEKTMRKAHLKEFIGDQWFFSTVNEAVMVCVRHQHLKRQRETQPALVEEGACNVTASDLETIAVHHGSEIGFSNDLHSKYTMVFVALREDVPMITAEITAAYQRVRCSIVQAHIEPMSCKGAKHTYLLKSLRTDAKLSDSEVDRLKQELLMVLRPQGTPAGSSPGPNVALSPVSGNSASASKVAQLEEALSMQQAAQQTMQQQIADQNKRIEALLKVCEDKKASSDTGGVTMHI